MDIKLTNIRTSHHWTRYAMRALVAYNTVMSLAVVAFIVDPSGVHWL